MTNEQSMKMPEDKELNFPKDLDTYPYPHGHIEGMGHPSSMADLSEGAPAELRSLEGVINTTAKMSPKGIGSERMRSSENIESGPAPKIPSLDEWESLSYDKKAEIRNKLIVWGYRADPEEPAYGPGSLSEQAGARDLRYNLGLDMLKNSRGKQLPALTKTSRKDLLK